MRSLRISGVIAFSAVCLLALEADSDEKAIRAVVANYVEARNAQDADRVAALFTSDADQLVSSGEWRKGRAAVVKGSLASTQSTGGQRSIDVESVRVIGHDAALADGRYELNGLVGNASRKMWTTFVFKRDHGVLENRRHSKHAARSTRSRPLANGDVQQDKAEDPKEDPIVAALAGESVTHVNSMGTVTRNCVVIRDSLRGAQVILAISDITGLRKLVFETRVLIVVASGLFTISAAAYASKQGAEVAIPVGLVGLLFAASYWGTRRASVLFLSNAENIESVKSSHRQADALIRAVELARQASLKARRQTPDIISRL